MVTLLSAVIRDYFFSYVNDFSHITLNLKFHSHSTFDRYCLINFISLILIYFWRIITLDVHLLEVFLQVFNSRCLFALHWHQKYCAIICLCRASASNLTRYIKLHSR